MAARLVPRRGLLIPVIVDSGRRRGNDAERAVRSRDEAVSRLGVRRVVLEGASAGATAAAAASTAAANAGSEAETAATTGRGTAARTEHGPSPLQPRPLQKLLLRGAGTQGHGL